MRGSLAERILATVRDVEDFPQPGVTFKDITPVLADGELLAEAVQAHADPYRGRVDLVAGLEARGFIFGAAVAMELGVGFLPVRKAGKLPGPTVGVDYALEYGSARVEVHAQDLPDGARVLVVDDVLATGGTAAAGCRLIELCGGSVVAVEVLTEIAALDGRTLLEGYAVRSLATV
ncbi:adenine phosphoribosyltransferase [Janibacter cremeus]|uniref:Adenine phosphoribosyltransferase n=1 Tax=Janibacter cremeus TaxID=1285192 RepID=A0A852VHX5_9MICO|nr:adenine phosphoribosyltransferase [Janibacter cremeus]NYF96707.1 adenine phosphoribosyltransferase [Janibacter cremeus]